MTTWIQTAKTDDYMDPGTAKINDYMDPGTAKINDYMGPDTKIDDTWI